MKVNIDCVHCYLKQAVSCMSLGKVEEDKQYEVLYTLMEYVKTLDITKTPAVNSTDVILKTYELIQNPDPYKDAKKQSNDLALQHYPRLEKLLEKSEDSLYDAFKICVAGNVIDLGINRSFDIDAALSYVMKTGFSRDDYELFRKKLNEVNEVLILGDNAGEIVFDKLLVKELTKLGKKVIYSVKGGPCLNDSTIEDAEYTGIDKVAQVVSTGSNYLGISLNHVSDKFTEILYNSKLIISKGQANFESLEHEPEFKGKVFYLLKIKCEYVGRVAEEEFGHMVFLNR